MTKTTTSTNLTRRAALKKLAGGAAAFGVGTTLGAPMIWAQSLKDVTLMHVGPSYSIFPDVVVQASADLGFKVEMQNAWTADIMTRMMSQPESIDIADLEFWALQRIWRAGSDRSA